MSNNLDVQILSAFRASREGVPINKTEFIRAAFFFEDMQDGLAQAYTHGYEAEIAGPNLPDWINPLAFDTNLAGAVAALSELDVLLADYSDITHLQQRTAFYKKTIPSEEWDEFEKITETIDYGGQRNTLVLRTSKKIEELLHYTKAAKLGAHLLYGFSPASMEFDDNSVGLERIRESLRILSNRYRRALTKYSRTTIKVSLKHMRNSDGTRISEAFTSEGATTFIDQLTPVFDLSDCRDFSGYTKVFINDIAVQVVDKAASETSNPRTLPAAGWHLRLESEANTIRLGEADDAPEYTLPKLLFSSVLGDYDGDTTVAARNPRIIGIDPRRKWQLEVAKQSNRDNAADSENGIYDIILHFDALVRV